MKAQLQIIPTSVPACNIVSVKVSQRINNDMRIHSANILQFLFGCMNSVRMADCVPLWPMRMEEVKVVVLLLKKVAFIEVYLCTKIRNYVCYFLHDIVSKDLQLTVPRLFEV